VINGGLGGGAVIPPQSSAGSGTISLITSSTLAVTGATGPTTDLELNTTSVTPGSYTASNITVDAYGRITAAANGSGGSGVTSLTGDVTGTGPGATATSLVSTVNVNSIISGNTTVAGALQKGGGTMSGAIAMGAFKITGLANGSAASDAAAFGQIPTALPPNGAASGDLSGSYPGPTVAQVNGVAISANAATLAAGLANSTTRTASATVLAGEETVFTGSTAAQTLTLPVTPTVGTINTIVNLSSVTVTYAAGAGNTLNNFGTVGSVTVPVKGALQFVFIGTVWYCIDSNLLAGVVGTLAIANGGTGATTASTALTALGGMATATYDAAAIAQQVLGTTATQTVTNKRITKRVLALSANSATPAINSDSYDVVHITAQTAAITSFTSSLTGTPVDGDTLRLSVTGTGAVALTFGTSFEASTVALPTTTVTTARLDMGFIWNTETSKWRIVAVA
jgi:hypothetical protein